MHIRSTTKFYNGANLFFFTYFTKYLQVCGFLKIEGLYKRLPTDVRGLTYNEYQSYINYTLNEYKNNKISLTELQNTLSNGIESFEITSNMEFVKKVLNSRESMILSITYHGQTLPSISFKDFDSMLITDLYSIYNLRQELISYLCNTTPIKQ